MRFQAAYPTDEIIRLARAEWAEGLAGLDQRQIAHGLKAWKEDWPPTLPEFRKACIGEQAGLSHNTAAYKRFPPALPKPKADPEIVKAELAKMRKMVKGD